MSRLISTTAAAVISLLFASPLANAGLTIEDGWQSDVITGTLAGAFVSGMDFLPNGNLAVFDGTSIIEMSTVDGTVVNTIYTPPGFVFGSFVTVAPSGTFLLFGESSNQTITKVPLDGSPTTLITSISFNYDLVFQSDSVAYLTAATGAFGTCDIFRLDIDNGTFDQIALVDGPSGPLDFDAAGNLYYGEASAMFPAPAGQQTIRWFTQSQVDNAFGIGHLTTSDSQVLVTGLTSPHDLRIDEEGDLFVSDSSEGFVRQYDQSGALKGTLGQEGPFNAATVMALRGTEVVGRFDGFQPASAGTLAVVSTDFFSFNDLNFISPARPDLAVTPGNPIPDGAVNVAFSGGPDSGMALLLLSGAALNAPEQHVTVNNASLFFAIDLGSPFIAILVPLDASGGFSINATNGPADAGTVSIQTIAIDMGGAPVGTSDAVTVTLL